MINVHYANNWSAFKEKSYVEIGIKTLHSFNYIITAAK